MEGGDPDAPTPKRARLDSVNSVYNGLPPPQPPPAQPTRHPSHPTSVQASSSPPARHYPPHSLPPPSQPYPSSGPGHFPGPHPSPSVPPSDIRTYSDPRNIPSPGQRTHGLPGPPVTLPARNIPQDSIATYRPPPPQSTSAPDQQSLRSAGISVDTKPPMEHGGHPGSWPPDPRHSSGLSNGYNPAISPPNPNEPPFHPPLPPGQGYGQPVNAYTPSPYMGQYAPGPGQARRKQVRATQACNHCRARKQKCDEARPCQFCRENNFDCQYKDVPPPKQDRSMMQLQDSVNNISDTLKHFVDSFNVWKQSVEGRLPPTKTGESSRSFSEHPSPERPFAFRGSMSEQSASRMPTPVQGRLPLRRVDSMKTESPIVPHSHMSPIAQSSTPIKQESMFAPPQPPATPASSIRTDHTQTVGDLLSKERGTGLLSDHRTPPHHVLEEWPTMKDFCNDIPTIRKLLDQGKRIYDYPMELEQARGLLRVWGVGEGYDSNDGAQGPGSPESNPEVVDMPSPASTKEGIWGCPPIEGSSPSTVGGNTSYPKNEGGLGPDGRPDFRREILFELLDSYLQHIHPLHPFLNPSKLRRMIKEFADVYSPEARLAHAMSPGTAVSHRLNPGIKRKRSSSAFGDGYFTVNDLSKGSIERSLRNAIVLLVLALGKVCQYRKGPLPAPHGDRVAISNGDWNSPQSAHNSFSSDDSDHRPRNIDILPGMAYYSYATDILGNQQGGNTVAHAQADLLAALYLGQYARVLESWSWINNACRICLVLIKADYNKITREAYLNKTSPPDHDPEAFRLNLVKCVYWTCLQLETDILAEMSTLPPTEISKHQETIMYPSGVFENFPEAMSAGEVTENDLTMWIYSSQIHLRVILNGAHNTLYGASPSNGGKAPQGFDTSNPTEVANAARVHADILQSWRNLLPPALAWDDSEPPSTDPHIARLRAKFYGGHYMILRPFLYMAVHSIVLPPAMSSHHSSPAALYDMASPGHAERSRPLVDLTSEQSTVLDIAHNCVKSAIQSTIAFDRVGADPNVPYRDYVRQREQRLILTNIFGTLHAQFGNMLVLAAVYRSPLRKYFKDTPLTKENLKALFHRTEVVLDEVKPNSPILGLDLEILQNVKRQLGL